MVQRKKVYEKRRKLLNDKNQFQTNRNVAAASRKCREREKKKHKYNKIENKKKKKFLTHFLLSLRSHISACSYN